MKRVHSPRRGRRGFTLVEVMISAAVLGIGIVALTDMHLTAERGLRRTRTDTTAGEIARQRLELLSTRNVASLPACGGVSTCRANQAGFAPELGIVGGFACTQWVDGMDLVAPEGPAGSGRYRVDTSIVTPTDLTQQPGARMIAVSVCWSDASGQVYEVRAQRMLVPEI